MKLNLGRSLRVLACLFLLLILTTLLAFLPVQPWNWIFAVVIAFVMAALIMLFFMKVRYSEPLLWLTSATGFVWLSLLVLLAFLDYLSRPWPR
jgi:caa(3)-type oxidase subunit IV